MSPQVTVVQVAVRPIAAVQRFIKAGQRVSDWRAASDKVWAFLRKRRMKGGYNTVLYTPGPEGKLSAHLGVIVAAPFDGEGDVVCVGTPEGEAAVVTLRGSYDGTADAHAAIAEWMRGTRRESAGVVWEVYGEWEKDAAKREAWVYHLLRPAAAS